MIPTDYSWLAFVTWSLALIGVSFHYGIYYGDKLYKSFRYWWLMYKRYRRRRVKIMGKITINR